MIHDIFGLSLYVQTNITNIRTKEILFFSFVDTRALTWTSAATSTSADITEWARKGKTTQRKDTVTAYIAPDRNCSI